MDITSFDDLLAAARQQADPPRLLFTFAVAELPPEADGRRAEVGWPRRLVELLPDVLLVYPAGTVLFSLLFLRQAERERLVVALGGRLYFSRP